MRRALLALSVVSVGCFSEAPPLAADSGTSGSTAGESPITDETTHDVTSMSASVDSGDTTSAGAGDCGAQEQCVAASEDWMGPFALALVVPDAEPPPCAAPYDTPYGVPLHEGLVEGALDCGCSCNTPQEDAACLATLYKYESDTTCGVTYSSMGINIMPGTCTITGSDLVHSVGYVEADGNDPQAPKCASEQGNVERQDSSWERDVVLCGLADAAQPCADGVCVPARPEPFEAVCILRAGDHDCPGDFSDEHVVHVEFDDQRTCDGCSCNAVAGDCSPIVYASTDNGCDDLDGGTPACADTSHVETVATTWQPASAPACEPVQAVTGEVAEVGTHTLCCRG